MKKYKVLMVTTDILEQQLNDLSQDNWIPILMTILQQGGQGTRTATVVLEKVSG
jgi:hypothetical protein